MLTAQQIKIVGPLNKLLKDEKRKEKLAREIKKSEKRNKR
jgi:hypothetical protein